MLLSNPVVSELATHPKVSLKKLGKPCGDVKTFGVKAKLYILEVADFPGETFRVLKEKEEKQYGELEFGVRSTLLTDVIHKKVGPAFKEGTWGDEGIEGKHI